MHRVRRKVMIQKTVTRNYSRLSITFLSTIWKFSEEVLMQNWGERIFSNRQMGMRVCIRIVMIMVFE